MDEPTATYLEQLGPHEGFIGAGAVIFAVKELGPVREFYTRVFRTEPAFVADAFIGYRLPMGWVGFDMVPPMGHPGSAPSSIAYLNVADIFDAVSRMVAAGARMQGNINEFDGTKLAIVIDPWGNVVGLSEVK